MSNLSPGLIVGIIILVLGVFACICCCYCRSKLTNRKDKVNKIVYQEVNNIVTGDLGSRGDIVVNPLIPIEIESSKSINPNENGSAIKKQGFLWKKSTSLNGDYKKRYFFIRAGHLYYTRQSKGDSSGGTGNLLQTIEVCNLLISTVKIGGRDPKEVNRFNFQLISPGQYFYQLQAESEQDMKDWVDVVRKEIELSLIKNNNDLDPPASPISKNISVKGSINVKSYEDSILIVPTESMVARLHYLNHVCVDCGAKKPEWASLNLCVLFCIECSGVHRSLGTHISKVRSLTLDKWSKNSLRLLEEIGNSRSNDLWEQHLFEKRLGSLSPWSSREERQEFITEKYVKREFVPKVALSTANSKLYDSASDGNVLDVLEAIAMGADINYSHPFSGKTPMKQAKEKNWLLVVELLNHWDALDKIDLSIKNEPSSSELKDAEIFISEEDKMILSPPIPPINLIDIENF